jgi:hypothetical protein
MSATQVSRAGARGYAVCSKCGVETDFIYDRPCDFCSQPKPEIGMGVTFGCWTDRHAGTIVAISKSGKQITVQGDTAIRTDKNGMSESQEYRYEQNPQAPKIVFKITERKGRKAWRSGSYTAGIGHRRAYHDFSF